MSKLRALAPGETLYLDDPRERPGQRPLAPVVMAAVWRSDALAGRTFTTAQMVAVRSRPAEARPILAITRDAEPCEARNAGRPRKRKAPDPERDPAI